MEALNLMPSGHTPSVTLNSDLNSIITINQTARYLALANTSVTLPTGYYIDVPLVCSSSTTAGHTSTISITSSNQSTIRLVSNSVYFMQDQPARIAPTPADLFRQKIRSQLLLLPRHRPSLKDRIGYGHAHGSEKRARESLRDMLSEGDYRKYLTNGFIIAKGSSGKWYQIFADRSHIRVYHRVGGKVEEAYELCIHPEEGPATDRVIALKTLVELDEDGLHQLANRHSPRFRPRPNEQNGPQDSQVILNYTSGTFTLVEDYAVAS